MYAKNYIVIHHSDTQDDNYAKDFDAIKRYHMQVRGWRNIGYTYVVEYVDGVIRVIQGRDENEDNAACIGQYKNFDGIHICLVGNYDEDTPTEEQYRVIAGLCKDIMTRHNIIEIGRHMDYDATDCPGQNFDIGRLRQLVNENEVKVGVPVTIVIGDKTFPAINKGGHNYFTEDVPVVDFIQALCPQFGWDGKTMTLNIFVGEKKEG